MARRLLRLNLGRDLPHLPSQVTLPYASRRCASDQVSSPTGSRFLRGPRSPRWPMVDAQIRQLRKLPEEEHTTAWGDLLTREVVKRLKHDSLRKQGDTQFRQHRSVLPLAVYVLEHARTIERRDVFACAARDVHEWLVIEPVVKLLLGACENPRSPTEGPNIIPAWITRGSMDPTDLNKLTENPVPLDFISLQRTSAVDIHKLDRSLSLRHEKALDVRSLSQLLMSLGNMVIEAADYDEDDRTHQTLMTAFIDVLAQLHHNGAIPSNIYNYDSPQDPTVITRPPLLQTFWARIMTHLTHVSWNKFWIGRMAEASTYGVDLPPPRHQYPGEPVGTEVWLEFLLWTCVEGGWMDEAAYIILSLEKRADHGRKAWSVISWEDVCRKKPPEMSWRAALRMSLGSPEGTFPTHKMGPRTISVEVVDAIMDGLANNPSTNNSTSKSVFQSNVEAFHACQTILSRSGYNLDAERANSLVLRLAEGTALLDAVSAERLDEVLCLSPTLGNAQEPNEAHQASLEQFDGDPSASILGLLHRNLEAFAIQSDEDGVKRTLGSILNVIDANRNLYIRLFANSLRQKAADSSPSAVNRQRATPLLHPQVSLHALEEVLDFVVRNKLIDVGDFLFHNDDIDEGFVQANVYSTPEIQPKLIEYATANSDSNVLARVLENLQPPVTPRVLHAFIRYRIMTHRWQEVEDILRQLSFSQDVSWNPGDVFTIAAYVIRYSDMQEDSDQTNTQRAYTVLNDILRGYYDALPDPSQRPNLSLVQIANQLKRILRSLPGELFTSLSTANEHEKGPLASTQAVPVAAFDHLLAAIVEKYGSATGQQLVDRWCLERFDIDAKKQLHLHNAGETVEKVVPLSTTSIRTVVAPLLEKPARPRGVQQPQKVQSRTSSPPETRVRPSQAPDAVLDERSLIYKWAVQKYDNLGESEAQLEKDMPGIKKLVRRSG